jgi:hypothetical protein
LRRFLSQNAETDLRRIDLHNQRHLAGLNWDGLDARQLTPHLKAYQRLLRLHPDSDVREALFRHGFDSAHRIASVSEHKFVREYASLFGGEPEQARAFHRRAVAVKGRVKHLWANVKDFAGSRYYRSTLFQNADPAMVEYFQNIPDYQQLFGGLDYCECAHCSSMIGPAAYFLDIMRITDEYITEPNTSIPPGYKLEERRPDLFDLELTCENTDHILPFLQIVNRILSHRIAAEHKSQGTGTLEFNEGEVNVTGVGTKFEQEVAVGDTIECAAETRVVTAIESNESLVVEKAWGVNAPESASYVIVPGDIAFKTLAVACYPFNLPFNRPLIEIRRYLEELKTRLSSVYRDFVVPQPDLHGVKPLDVAREYLLLSDEEYRIVTTPDPTPESLTRYYGFNVTEHLTFEGDGYISFAAGQRDVTGDDTSFSTQLGVGDQIRCVGQTRTVGLHGSGVVTFVKGQLTVNGVGTFFLSELAVGDRILCRDEQRTVTSIPSNTRLQVNAAWQSNASGADYGIVYQDPNVRLIVDAPWGEPGVTAEKYIVMPWDSLEHVETFTYRTGLSRAQLVELFYQQLDEQELAAGVADTFFINQTSESLPYLQIVSDESDPLFSYSKIVGLSLKRLDRLNRFIRLASKLGWSYADLDWCLKSIGAEELTASAIESIALVKRLQDTTGLAVPVLCSFWYDIKPIGRVEELKPQDLFDRVYNNPALLDGQNPYVKNDPPVPFDPAQPLPWHVNAEGEHDTPAGSLNDIVSSRLIAALAVSDNDLTEIGNYLLSLEDKDTGTLQLDMSTLTWLYRFALLAPRLGLSVDEYFVLLCLMYYPESPYLQPTKGELPESPAGVAEVVEAADWLRLSPFSVYDLQYILTGVVNGGLDPGYTTDAIPPFVNNLSTISEGSRVTRQSFIFEDIDADESAQKFDALLAANFVSGYGIVLNEVVTYDSLAFLFPVTAKTFVTQAESGQLMASAQGAAEVVITPEESAQAFAELQAHGIIVVAEQQPYGTLIKTFNAATPLDFLFTSEGSGQSRTIAAYDADTRVATVAEAWLEVPNTTSHYQVSKTMNSGMAQGGTPLSITLAADASADDDAYVGMQVKITGGAGAGETRTVSAYDGASKVAAVDQPWLDAPTAASQYVVNSILNSGTAQGGSATTITLALNADGGDEDYVGTQVVIVPDPKAEFKRAAVRSILLQIQRDINHTVDVFMSLEALQENNVEGGLAEFLGSTPDMLAVLLPFAALVAEVPVYLEAFLTPIPEGFEHTFQPTLSPYSFVMNYIDAEESAAAFDELVAVQLIIPEAGGDSGTVSPDFNATTSLDFLFADDPNAVAMRQQVRTIMLLSQRAQSVYALMPLLARAVLLVNRLQLTPFETASIIANPAAFDIQVAEIRETGQLTLGNVQSLALFKTLELAFDDTDNQLIRYFEMPPDDACPGSKIDALASLTGWNAEQICALIALFWPADKGPYRDDFNTVLGVARLKRCFDLSALTGVDIYFLLRLCGLGQLVGSGTLKGWSIFPFLDLAPHASPTPDIYTGMQVEVGFQDGHRETRTIARYEGGDFRRAYLDAQLSGSGGPDFSIPYKVRGLAVANTNWEIINRNWDYYVEMAGSLLDAIKARNSDDEFARLYASITDELNTVERDALLGYSIWLLNQQHPSILYPSDVYKYLLIDVEMSGCADASLISEGIAAVQLYMQRCRMNLEAGVTELTLIPDAWWQWMSSYRIWEANRKIFLYPENYLVPSLRRNQTPLFTKLSEELLQTNITDHTVTTAYTNYFDGFDVLANLAIGPSFHCTRFVPTVIDSSSAPLTPLKPVETLYLFGRTSTLPYTYYYRTYENAYTDNTYLNWTPWVKIGLTINAPYVTPAYAFDRLFIFWTEFESNKSSSVKGAGSETQSQSVVKAVVKYSFLNGNGQWAQPQQLAQYIVVTAEPYNDDNITKSDYVKSLFVPESLEWQQPYVLRIPRGYVGAGTIDFNSGETSVSGAYTLFTKQLKVGDMIWCGGEQRIVAQITDNRRINVEPAWEQQKNNSLYRIIPASPTATGTLSFRGTGTVNAGTESGCFIYGTVVNNVPTTAFMSEAAPGDQILIVYGNMSDTRVVLQVDSQWRLMIDAPLDPGHNYIQATYFITKRPAMFEKLLVIYGSDIDTTKQLAVSKPKITPNDGKDPFIQSLNEFNDALFQSLQLASYGRANIGPKAGYVPARPGIFLEQSLLQSEAKLIIPNFDYGSLQNPQPYAPALDRATASFRIVESANMIQSNYWSNSVPPGGDGSAQAVYQAMPAGGLPLLYNISARFASVFSAANRPGSFVFNNGDESFLVTTSQLKLCKISDTLLLRPYPVATDNKDTQGLNNVQVASGAYTDAAFQFNSLKFTFTRLSTHTIGALSRRLLAGGVESLLTVAAQETTELPFSRFYDSSGTPPPNVDTQQLPPPKLDFNGSFGAYFWEVFFHAPWLVADQLNAGQRFEDAKRWYEFIFNPTQQPEELLAHPNDRFWRFLPLRNLTPESLTETLTDPAQIAVYNNEPFEPFSIANLRPTAYQKAIVMRYIDNLLDWGDMLFAQDTRESITSATNLYVMAADLLGPRPVSVGPCPAEEPATFAGIKAEYASQGKPIPEFLIQLENTPYVFSEGEDVPYSDVPFNDIDSYFCVPENEEFMAYWARVEDRLFKIRHCMNIQGVERRLALFEPPINPRALIEAAASGAGVSLGQQVVTPLPNYRFSFMVAAAKDFAGQLIQLGSSLLAAIEKQDAEQLALLMTTQERAILNLTTQIKQSQVQQAADMQVSLTESRDSAEYRAKYYGRLLDKGLSPGEIVSIASMQAALFLNVIAGVFRTLSSAAYALPNVGSPFAMTYGGVQVGSMLNAASSNYEIMSYVASHVAETSLTMSGYKRRAEDWEFQQTLAEYDRASIQAQMAANQSQMKIAERDLEVHYKTIEQNEERELFLTKKFTNRELYAWMVSRLSAIYFQTYSLAYDLARAAQRAYQYELNTEQTFVNFGYWDNLHKGLLAGEGLMLALNQMEKAYIDGNVRTLEIERTISLLQLNPKALLDLKNTGECVFELTEKFFDYDYPGHYCRKIKALSVTIPAVVGPYQSIKATLTQLTNHIILRPEPNANAVNYLLGGDTPVAPGPETLRSNWQINQRIAISRAVDDTGLFVLNFGDERYLPFEGTGAVSTWRLSMPRATNQFNFAAIADVIIKISYTALDGGAAFRQAVVSLPAMQPLPWSQFYSLSQNFSQQWFDFMNVHPATGTQTMSFPLANLIPPNVKPNARLIGFYLALDLTAGASGASANSYIKLQLTDSLQVSVLIGAQNAETQILNSKPAAAKVAGERRITFDLNKTPNALKKPDGFLNPAVLRNIVLILYFEGEADRS